MSKQSKTPHELTKDVALLHRAVSNLDSRVSNLTGSTGRDLTQLSGLYNDLEAKADQALAVGNGCHQQIADLNRALVSTVAKADESLKSGAVALRSITECETDLDAWKAQRSGVQEKIKSTAKEGKPTKGLIDQLHELDKDRPIAPRMPRLLYSDATPEALDAPAHWNS